MHLQVHLRCNGLFPSLKDKDGKETKAESEAETGSLL